ncbi:MAG: tetratricopeptide repeat protein [Cyanobacteria bacterium]|nr:tetratricopeptide repeat protein [Cyanobacteriota bacterium]
MQELLPKAYLIGLIVLLGAAAVLVGRQILRVRKDEEALARLSSAGPGGAPPTDSVGLYELASVQLRKRLYGQAVDNLKLALRKAQAEKAPDEARALIENAYGFALAAETKFSEAIRHYRSALQIKPDYPVALNNLAYALGKLGEPQEARDTYARVLDLEPANGTARKGIKTMERRVGDPTKAVPNSKPDPSAASGKRGGKGLKKGG